ncbi:MAG: sigma-70 family RNA polymerase sigma factor [Sedimentisphaerales bacterium]|nr:sigma-70 family RNA polymerase sigma factor [Sedimentisphaerales bacterium]
MNQKEETILVQAAADGDVECFNRLCKQYYPAIVAICYSQLADRDLAEDAAQEAFFVAFRDLSKLKRANYFGRWLTGISRNIAVDMAKARKKENFIPAEDCNSVSKEQDVQDDHVEAVRIIIAALPVKVREIIYLRFYNQMSYQEIANLLGTSQEAVNGRLRRAKKIIAKRLNHRNFTGVDL